jgi:arylsulfatase A
MKAPLLGGAVTAHPPLYWEFTERGFQQAVRMGQWKALRLKAGAPLELYDLDADLGETRDLAATRPEIVARVEEYLKTARTESARWPSSK